MEKLKMHSPNLTQDNIARIAELFPGCVTEAKGEDGSVKLAVDFDQLRQELAESIVEGPQERYHMDWPGKREALLTSNAPIAKTLRPCYLDSVNFNTTKNLFIEGDNLEALKLLQETYLGKVKLIYIDPPYNTGSDFIYSDDFAEASEAYMRRSNQKDDEGKRLVVNSESNGRFHSDWMTMMFSRLRLARSLLRDDGIILASIGQEEVKNLIALLGEVFGEDNRISVLTWEKGRKNDSTFFSESTEYMIAFAKSKEYLATLGKWRERKEGLDLVLEAYNGLRATFGQDHSAIEKGMRKFYAELEESAPAKKLAHFSRSDDKGLFFGDNISSASTSIPDYEIIHPITKRPVKKPARGWGATEPVMLERIKNNEVHFGPDETTIPLKKSYLAEVDSIVKTPVIYKDGRAASVALKGIFGGVVFNNPKDHTVLADIFSYCLQADREAIILDFFAGSGSTAHAVFQLNNADGGRRRFILVQIPETLDVEAATTPVARQATKRATDFLASINKPLTIAEISKERIRRVGSSISSEGKGTDTGFRVLKIDASNMADIYYAPDVLDRSNIELFVDNIKPDRTPEDLLFQVMLDWGVDLALPIAKQTIQGKDVFLVDGNALAACFDGQGGVDEAFVKELAKVQPLRVVFRDAGFKDSSVKINVEQIFKLLSPAIEVKCI